MELDKDFIPYEEALALKELGFDEPCMAQFNSSNGFDGFGGNYKNSYFNYPDQVALPLYQQAFRWFREKYNFDVSTAKDSHKIYHFQINTNHYGNWILPIFNRNYGESEVECLKKLIELCKNN